MLLLKKKRTLNGKYYFFLLKNNFIDYLLYAHNMKAAIIKDIELRWCNKELGHFHLNK